MWAKAHENKVLGYFNTFVIEVIQTAKTFRKSFPLAFKNLEYNLRLALAVKLLS